MRIVKNSFSFSHLPSHGWWTCWKHKTTQPTQRDLGTIQGVSQGWAEGILPAGPAAASSPRGGAAQPWLKAALPYLQDCVSMLQ